MVGAKDIGQDFGVGDALLQAIAHHEVVDAPTRILLAGLKAIRPPRIGDLLRIFPSEGVGEACCQELRKLRPLLVRESRVHAIGLRVLQVYLLVGHVQVAAQDDGFLLIEAEEILTERIFPRHAIVEALQTVLRVGRIAAHQEEVLHLERHHPTLMIVVVDADAIGHIEGFVLGKDGCAGVAFLLGIVPIRLIAIELQVQLTGLHLRFLQAEEVRIYLAEDVAEALAFASPQSVDVPRNQFHIVFVYKKNTGKVNKKTGTNAQFEVSFVILAPKSVNNGD